MRISLRSSEHAGWSTRLTARLRGPALASALAALGLLASPAPAAAAETKVAVIDVRRAMLETEEGLRVSATLKKLFDSRQAEIDNKQRALQQDKDGLERDAKGGKVSQEQLARRYEKLQKDAADLQVLGAEYQREMQRKETEMTTPIYARIMGIVRRIAAQDGFEMVLEKSAVPYFRADLELTDRAIQLYNSGQAGDVGPGKPGAAPAADPSKGGAQKPPATPKPAPAPAPKTK
jgi:outer membrane protein